MYSQNLLVWIASCAVTVSTVNADGYTTMAPWPAEGQDTGEGPLMELRQMLKDQTKQYEQLVQDVASCRNEQLKTEATIISMSDNIATLGGSFEAHKVDEKTKLELIETSVEENARKIIALNDTITYRHSCPPGWVQDKKCYRFTQCTSRSTCTAERAREACARNNASLVHVESLAEDELIVSLPGMTRIKIVIIEGTDVEVEGTWVWPDGSTMAYTNWSNGNPNNSDGSLTPANCVCIVRSKLRWFDIGCGQTFDESTSGYVCEKPII